MLGFGDNLKIMILGAGNLGCVLAGIFRQGGAEVTLYDRNESALEKIRREGVTISMKDSEIHAEGIRTESMLGELRSFDLVACTVKSTQTEDLMGELMSSAGADTMFFTMQSGIENVDHLSVYIPREKILCGMAYWSMEQKAPGEIILRALSEHPVELGMMEANRDSKSSIKDLRKVFEKAGFTAEIKKEVQPVIWKNAIFQSGIQPVSALLRLKTGILAADENGQWLMQHIWKEGCNISRAEGLEDLWPEFQKLLPEIQEQMDDISGGMAEDLWARRRHTEIAGLNEVLIARGKSRGVPTPVNQSVSHMILALQANLKAVGSN